MNLEEIWAAGAIVDAEDALEQGAEMTIRGGGGQEFSGRVVRVIQHEFGWFAEVEFAPLSPWSKERFLPLHLLELEPLELDPGEV